MENVFLTSLTTPEVRQLFRQELQSFFAETKPLQQILPEEDHLLTIREAAELLHLSVQTIYALVSKSEIPVNKKSKRLYFSKQELTDWVKAGRKKTNTETAAEADHFLSTAKRKAAKHG